MWDKRRFDIRAAARRLNGALTSGGKWLVSFLADPPSARDIWLRFQEQLLRPGLHWLAKEVEQPREWIESLVALLWNQAATRVRSLWNQADTRVKSLWGWFVKRLHLRAHRGPGWLSYEIHGAMKQAKRTNPLPPWSIRSAFAAPRIETVVVLILLLLVLLVASGALAAIHVHVPGLASDGDRISVFTTMWQVQAGIAALALPVLTVVIERARDEQQAALHSAEVLGRESWSFLIIGFSFVVVARMGVDLAFFPNKPLVFLTDVLLFLVTIAAAVFAYYRVLRITLSPSTLRRRSIDLAREKTRNVLLESVQQRTGDNILFQLLTRLSVRYWPLGADNDPRYLVLESKREGTVLDIHLENLQHFIETLPRRGPAPTTGQPSQPTAALSIDDQPVWILVRYGSRLSGDQRGLLRLNRDSFHAISDTRRRLLEDRLSRIIVIGETDEL